MSVFPFIRPTGVSTMAASFVHIRLSVLRADLRPEVERLEGRECPSVFYDFEIIAKSNQGSIGATIQPAVSINDSGNVAFVAASGVGQDIFLGTAPGTHKGISDLITSNRTYFQELHINNHNQIGAVAIQSGATVGRFARIYNANNVGDFRTVGRATSPQTDSSHFDSIGGFVSLSNDGQMSFAGFESTTPSPPPPPVTTSSWEVHLADGLPFAVDRRDALNTEVSEVATMRAAPEFFRMMAADGDRVVIGTRYSTTGPKSVTLYDITGIDTSEVIAETGPIWSDLGVRAGISDNGEAVAFYGELTAAGATSLGLSEGMGIFASVLNPAGQRVVQRIVGLTNNGKLDPGETFNDADGDGQLDAGSEVDLQPLYTFTGFDPDARVSVEFKGGIRDTVQVVFIANDEVGREGVYTADLVRLPTPATGYTVTTASAVARVGHDVPGFGTLTDVAVLDAVNSKGQVAVWAKSGTTDAILRGNPERTPVLIVPGIAGSFMAPGVGYREWLTTRGIVPNKLQLDPLARVYADQVQTFRNLGYVEGRNLFLVPYDWRLPVGPTDGTADGNVSVLTATSLTDTNFEYGVDYLGYWLKQAAEAWKANHGGREVPSVDIVAHSMGGLVTRSYLQSPAYHGSYGTGRLPKVDNFVMLATPNEGAVKAFNPYLQDNWNTDPLYKTFLSKWLLNAYRKVLTGGPGGTGGTIAGPQPITLATIAPSGQPDADSPMRFIKAYAPSIRDLLPTFNFQDNTGAGALTNINGNPPAERNELVLDLNAGSLITAPTNDPYRFAATTRATVVYGTSEPTVWQTVKRTGPGSGGDVIAPFDYYQPPRGFARPAGQSEVWYEDQVAPNFGDATVPLNSLKSRFPTDKRFRVFELTGAGVSHTEVVSNPAAQAYVLRVLGLHENLYSPSFWSSVIQPLIGFGQTLSRATFVLGTVAAMVVDPVDAVLIDDQGRRVGYRNGAALTEIPGSLYFGDTDGFAFIPTVPNGLRLQLTGLGGSHMVAAVVGPDNAGLRNQGTLAAGQTLELTFLGVASFAVNGGAQRSRVTSLTVEFTQQVSVSAANFAIAGFAGTLTVTTQVVNGRTVATLTFSGTGTQSGSLADGRYTLTVSGVPGLTGVTTYDFHRLYGDWNGDASVTLEDYEQFGAGFGLSAGDPGWALFAAFDFNADGTINMEDYEQFGSRFGASL
jgi:hypothetical protein